MQTRSSRRSTFYRGVLDNDDNDSNVSELEYDSSVESDSSWDSDSLSDCKQPEESDDEDGEGMSGRLSPLRMTLRSTTVDRDTPKPKLSYKVEPLDDMKGHLYSAFDQNNDPMTVEKWTKLMSENSARGKEVRLVTANAIADAPCRAVMFETKGVTLDTARRLQFRFVMINSNALHRFGERGSDAHTFASHFMSGKKIVRDVVAFDNLGRDARLVAPVPLKDSDPELYSHLAKFVREGSASQIDRLFLGVAKELWNRLVSQPDEPVWLSTSGLGVAWLHVRLDSSPKYYEYEPFAAIVEDRQTIRPTDNSVEKSSNDNDPNGTQGVMVLHKLEKIQKKTKGGHDSRRRCSWQGCRRTTYLICQHPTCIADAERKKRLGMFVCRKHHAQHALKSEA